jgi:hypothetical protein
VVDLSIFTRAGRLRREGASSAIGLLVVGDVQHLQPTNRKAQHMTAQQETLFRELTVVALEALAQGRTGAAQDAIAELRTLTEA